MKATIKYPLFFMAKPPKARKRYPIASAYPLETEIPEISAFEADVVFSAEKAFNEKGTHETSETRLISHGGRLFRRISKSGEFNRLFRTAYGHSWGEVEAWRDYISVISHAIAVNPVTNLLQFQIGWQLMAQDSPHLKSKVYPSAHSSGQAWYHTDLLGRNEFSEVIAVLSDIDRDLIEAGLVSIDHQAGKLLLVENELWMEASPPAIMVSIGRGSADRCVTKTLVHLQECALPQMDMIVSRRCRQLWRSCARQILCAVISRTSPP